MRQISDTEFWVGESKSKLIDQNIIHVIAVGDQTKETSNLQLIINDKIMRHITGKINFLIDLNSASKNSVEARQIWKRISEQETTNKVAMFGLHPVARVLASFAMGVSNSNNQRFFKTKEEAMSWILE